MIPAADILRTILADSDVIGQTPDDRTWFLIAALLPWLEQVTEFQADTEDAEPGSDDKPDYECEDTNDAEPNYAA